MIRLHPLQRTLCAIVLCAMIGACGDNSGGGAPTAEDVEWTAALTEDGTALTITPVSALRGNRTYAVVLTNGIADASGRLLQADTAFRRLLGTDEAVGEGPVALFAADVEAAGNPYPEARLVRENRTVHVPSRYALRGLPDDPSVAVARRFLRATADGNENISGFSTTAPIRIALSAPIDLATVNPSTVRFFERDDGALCLSETLRDASRRGIEPEVIALAIAFPTQPIEDDLRAVRAQLFDPPPLAFDDPDPADDLPIGVFGPDDAPFAEYLAAHPSVGAVARGLLAAPDFRRSDGRFDAERIAGRVAPLPVEVDVIITLPATGARPAPVVVLQHGFAGSNLSLLELAAELADEGFATVALSALSHGRRGNPLDLLTGTPLQVRDLFRQTVVDQMSLVRAIEAGIDLTGDGDADLLATDVGYLGVSLGGILGATLVAVEDVVVTSVLNVAGGRVAFLGDNPGTRPIYAGSYAERVGLTLGSPLFETFLQRLLELGQHALDPADGLNYAHHWMRAPFRGVTPRRVLLQEGIGDLLVSNASTEALATAGGLAANVAVSDPAGVSGLWRFEPPGGHGIIARADVRAQAVAFLRSRGTEIRAPEGFAQ